MKLTLCASDMQTIALAYAANNLHLQGRFNVATPQPDGSFVLTWDAAAVVVKRRWWQSKPSGEKAELGQWVRKSGENPPAPSGPVPAAPPAPPAVRRAA